MRENINKFCPNCGSGVYKGEYFNCGSYYYHIGKTGISVEKKEGYIFHQTLECAHICIKKLNDRLIVVEEYVKKQTEIPKKNLKSLEEYNRNKIQNYSIINNLNSGFACPKCGEEMFYINTDTLLWTIPPTRTVRCYNCKNSDYVYC